MSDPSWKRPSVWELVAVLVLLPPLAYSFGFFLWAGPSRALYGVNLRLDLGTSALLLPGTVYLVVLVLAAILAILLGSERLIPYIWPKTRVGGIAVEMIGWGVLIVGTNLITQGSILGLRQSYVLTGAVETVYLPVHVLIVSFSFRRIYGLTRSRWWPAAQDHRPSSSSIRILRGITVILILYAQVALALLYGVLGPNPAKYPKPILIRQEGTGDRKLLLIERRERDLLGYDKAKEEIIRITVPDSAEIVYLPRETAAGAMGSDHSGANRILDKTYSETEQLVD